MSDILEALRQQVKERATSPLSGAFILSWLVINYQFFLVIFSDVKPWVKVGYIKTNLFPDLTAILLSGIAYPLLAAALYILLYPHPARWALKYSLSMKRKAREARNEAESLMPMTREDVDAAIVPLRDKIAALQADLEKKETNIERLSGNLDRAEQKHGELLRQLEASEIANIKAEEQKESLRLELAGSHGEIDQLKKHIKEASDAYETFELLSKEKTKSLENDNSELAGQLSSFKKQLSQAKTELDKRNAEDYASLASYGKTNSLSAGLTLSDKYEEIQSRLKPFPTPEYLKTLEGLTAIQATVNKIKLPPATQAALDNINRLTQLDKKPE
ncbi:hypothetical protein [Marinobacter sp.]|uniref:hypothetical protein n=1 Tax=Marinobacter sp. TaxID=50741 RepID=UPI003A94650F